MKYKKIKRKTRIEEFLDPWQLKRKQRIAFIMRLLSSQGEVNIDQFLGSISTEYGIRRQTLKEYLKDLQDYGVIEVKDGKIVWIEIKSEESE